MTSILHHKEIIMKSKEVISSCWNLTLTTLFTKTETVNLPLQ